MRVQLVRAGRYAQLVVVLAATFMPEPAAAQKLQIKIDKASDVDFKTLRTYAWLPPAPMVKNVAPDAVSNPTLTQEALGPHIVAAVDRELAARGFVQAPSDVADVHVAYFAALTTGFDQTYLGEYYGYVTGWASPIPSALAPSTSMTVYEKGTVVVDIVDRASHRAIWRGSVLTRIAQDRTLEKRIERINDGAARLFKQFPVSAKKK